MDSVFIVPQLLGQRDSLGDKVQTLLAADLFLILNIICGPLKYYQSATTSTDVMQYEIICLYWPRLAGEAPPKK